MHIPVTSPFTSIMSKRRRGTGGFRVTAPRPIDKRIISITKAAVGATKATTKIITATTACTVVGLRWNFFVVGDAGSQGTNHDYSWAIVFHPDGENANNPDLTDAATFYTPEQNVLAWGVGSSLSDGASVTSADLMDIHWEGTTKTMRKLRIGNKISFLIEGIATETVRVKGAVQLFCKF